MKTLVLCMSIILIPFTVSAARRFDTNNVMFWQRAMSLKIEQRIAVGDEEAPEKSVAAGWQHSGMSTLQLHLNNYDEIIAQNSTLFLELEAKNVDIIQVELPQRSNELRPTPSTPFQSMFVLPLLVNGVDANETQSSFQGNQRISVIRDFHAVGGLVFGIGMLVGRD